MGSSFGAFAALAAAGIVASSRGGDILRVDGWPDPNVQPMRRPAPTGPVIDTTPESKRARRRRLAREGGQHG